MKNSSFILSILPLFFLISETAYSFDHRSRMSECSSACNTTVRRGSDGRSNPDEMYQCISACRNDGDYYQDVRDHANKMNQQQNSGGSNSDDALERANNGPDYSQMHVGGCTLTINGISRSATAEECARGGRDDVSSYLKGDKKSDKLGGSDGRDGEDAKTEAASRVDAGCPANRARGSSGACDIVIDPSKETADSEVEAQDRQVARDEQRPQLPAEACENARIEVESSCDTESKGWMKSISNTTRALGPSVNQVNPGLCGGIAAATTGAAGALATFEMMCHNALETCKEACVGGAGADPTIATNLAACKAKGTKASDANQQMAQAMVTMQSSVAACKNAFGDIAGQAEAHCAANPAACQFNMPQLQTSNYGADQAGMPTPGSLDHQGAASANNVGGSSGFNLSDLGDESQGLGTIKPAVAGQDIGGAKGGGGAAGGSSGGEGAPVAGGGKKGGSSGFLPNILSGFFGSGGGSSGGGGGGWKSFFGGGKNNDGYGGGSQAAKGPDLRQFLPGAMNDPLKHRGIAGQIVGKDGMTGPHSDIWKNIKNRYQYKRASLLP